MRTIFSAPLNGFVGNEPSVTPTAKISSKCVLPTRDVALIRVGDTQGEPINFDATAFRQMEDIFVAVV